jgi:hypothetical protein
MVLQETQRCMAGSRTRASSAPTQAGGTVSTGHGAVRTTRSGTPHQDAAHAGAAVGAEHDEATLWPLA